MGLFASGTIGLGRLLVSGRSLVPSPPAIMMLFTGIISFEKFVRLVAELWAHLPGDEKPGEVSWQEQKPDNFITKSTPVKEGRGGAAHADKGLAMLASMGNAMVVSTLLGLIIGIYLDKYFGTKPWLTIIFLIFGIAAGFRNIYELTRKYGFK